MTSSAKEHVPADNINSSKCSTSLVGSRDARRELAAETMDIIKAGCYNASDPGNRKQQIALPPLGKTVYYPESHGFESNISVKFKRSGLFGASATSKSSDILKKLSVSITDEYTQGCAERILGLENRGVGTFISDDKSEAEQKGKKAKRWGNSSKDSTAKADGETTSIVGVQVENDVESSTIVTTSNANLEGANPAKDIVSSSAASGSSATSPQPAVRRKSKHVVLFNFASARNPGGGFQKGSLAQEECLARSSNLYSSLTSKIGGGFYNHGKGGKHALQSNPHFDESKYGSEAVCYSDRILYSNGVTFFRDDNGNLLTEDEVYTCDVVTCASINRNKQRMGGGGSKKEKGSNNKSNAPEPTLDIEIVHHLKQNYEWRTEK